MFLLVSGRHVDAHTDGHQHRVSIQISINLGKKFLRISHIRKIAVTRILARVFAYLPFFISQILDFIYWPVLIFILIYFELRDTENQQLRSYKNVNERKYIGGKIRLFASLLPTGRMYAKSITELVVYEYKQCELLKFAYSVLVIKNRSTRSW